MKKLLVTGAGGFLGQRTAAYYASSYEVVPCTHQTLDITNEIAVHRLIAAERPDFVLHCAAIADTGYAQAHPEVSEAVNLRGTVNLARACATYDAKLVYMSSDQVYSGNTESFALPEEIPLSPNNIYGQQKKRLLPAAPALLRCGLPGCMTCPPVLTSQAATCYPILMLQATPVRLCVVPHMSCAASPVCGRLFHDLLPALLCRVVCTTTAVKIT